MVGVCVCDMSFSKIIVIASDIRGATSSQASAEKALHAVLAEMPHVLPFEVPKGFSHGFSHGFSADRKEGRVVQQNRNLSSEEVDVGFVI